MVKKVLIIGGTGFLGKKIIEGLLDKGYAVRLLHRKSSNLEGIPKEVEKVIGDVTDFESLKAAYKGVDYAIHSAALVTQWMKDRSVFDRINVAGLDNSLRAAKEAGVKKIVYTSSFMALGPSIGAPSTEKDLHKRNKFFNDYERTKYLAELKLDDYIAEGIPLVTVYPGVIYGPGDLTEGNIVIRNFLLPRARGEFLGLFLLGKGKGLWSYSYVDDVAAGHINALEKGKIGESYVLAGDNADHRKLFALLHKYSGVNPPPLRMPFWAAKMKGALDLSIAKIFGKQPGVTPGAVGVFQKDWAYDSTKAIKEIDYKTRSLEEGMKKTIEWLKREGYVKTK
jgi:farnesol dehydrogenase